jgi:hypothetical protein
VEVKLKFSHQTTGAFPVGARGNRAEGSFLYPFSARSGPVSYAPADATDPEPDAWSTSSTVRGAIGER